ncbi:MAG: phosphatase PAP2 family protein [Actinomycetota bacterium]|nr:phosphatase PAP2 family protein [Actinomycetota bacterium]
MTTQTDRNPTQLCRSWLKRGHAAARRTRWWRELALVAAFYSLYDIIRGLIGGGSAHAQRDGHDLLHWEQLLHLDPEHWLNSHLQQLPVLAVPACFFYATLHFVVTPAVLLWTYRHRRADYATARTVLAVITAAALIGFWRFPTAPPRLLSGARFHDTLVSFSNWGWWGSDASVPAGATAIANQFAAMPSLHLAWASWCGATVFTLTRRRWVRWLAITYPVLTTLVVLGTANHYLLDVLAGAGLWMVATVIVRLVHPDSAQSRRADERELEPR